MEFTKVSRLASMITLLTVLLASTVAAEQSTEANIILMISFIAFIVKLGLAIWVYLKNPSAKVNRFFGIVFLGQAVWDFGKFMMWQIHDPSIAIIWGRISYTGYVISVFFFLQFIWAYLKKKNWVNKTNAGKTIFFISILTMLILVWTTNTVIHDVVERDVMNIGSNNLWAYDYGVVYDYFWLWFQIIPFIYGLFLFAFKYFKTNLTDKKKQILYVMIGSSFPIIIGIPTGVILPALGIVLPPHNNILTLIMSVFITIGIAKYKFLAIEPVGEKAVSKKLSSEVMNKFKLDYSNFYLIRHSQSVEMSYDILLNYLNKKHYGLIISSREPGKIKKEHGIQTTPIVWMTDSETEHLAIDPVDIEQLHETVRRFCKKVKNAFVMLDGIDYLLQHNNFSKILHFIEEVKIILDKNGGVLIIPEGNLDITPNQQRLIDKELTLLPHSKTKIAQNSNTAGLSTKFKTFRHIILGFNPVTESLLAELEKENINPTIVTTKNIHHHIPPGRLKVIIGDPLSKRMLIKAGVERPNTIVLITMDEDSEAILAINKIRQLSETTMVVTNINNDAFIPIASKAGANHVVPSSSIGGRLISLTLCAPNAVRWMMDATTLANKEVELIDVDVTKKDFFVGKTVKKADDDLKQIANIIAVKNSKEFQKIPDDKHILEAGDKLVLVANLKVIKKRNPEDIRKAISNGTVNMPARKKSHVKRMKTGSSKGVSGKNLKKKKKTIKKKKVQKRKR